MIVSGFAASNKTHAPRLATNRAMGLEHDLHGKARLNLLIQFIAMPGYICSVLFLSRVSDQITTL